MTKKLDVEFTSFEKNDNWTAGICGDYRFEAKLFDEGSSYGIKDGRVSKLGINYRGECIVNYDRGWDVKVTKEHRLAYNAIMKFLNDAPLTRFKI